ncbi:MAG: hypothetical protein IPM14_05325 [bacterium]|nr:hypothetical protein [bacterium]
MTSYILRDGKSIPADEVFNAWSSNDLNKMLSVLDKNTHPVDRHFLLQGIINETYKQRNEKEKLNICRNVCELFLEEWPKLADALVKDFGGQLSLPRISVFQNYATLLAEAGEYDKAIAVCEIAIKYRLNDGTKSGYNGRIERLLKQKSKSKII